MINKLRQLNEALPEMLFIDFVYLILGEILILIFAPLKFKWAIGFFAGVLYSVFGTFQLSFRIRKVVYGGGNVTAILLVGYFVRLGVMLALLTTLYYTDTGDLIAALIGMFSMKVAAYSQPFTNKFLSKITKKGR